MSWLIIFIIIFLIVWYFSRGKVFMPDENTESEKIMQIEVAGSKHYNIKLRRRELERLSDDPSNEYDKNAIEILTMDGKMIGYVPKRHNKKILQIMKSADVFGKVIAVYYRDTEVHVDILKHTPPA